MKTGDTIEPVSYTHLMEKGMTDPQLSTVLKILNSLGKTIKIVPMK